MGGCLSSKLKHHRRHFTRVHTPTDVNSNQDVHRRKSITQESKSVTGGVAHGISIIHVYASKDEQTQLLHQAAESMGHHVVDVQINPQEALKWQAQCQCFDQAAEVAANRAGLPTPVHHSGAHLGARCPFLQHALSPDIMQSMLELVIIDRRIPSNTLVADSFCAHFRANAPSGGDAVIVALIPHCKNPMIDSATYEVLQVGYNKFMFPLKSLAEASQQLLLFQCNELSILRRLRYITRSSESRSLASQYNRLSETSLVPKAATEMSRSQPVLQAKPRSASISETSALYHASPNDPTTPLMATINEMDEKSSETPGQTREEKSDVKSKESGITINFRHVAARRFSCDTSMCQSNGHPRLSVIPMFEQAWTPSSLANITGNILTERENRMRNFHQQRRSKRASRLSGSLAGNALLDRTRDSITRLQSQISETPLEKVLHLISGAQSRASATVAKDLQKAVELILSHDLFSGLLKPNSRNLDPMTADLIGGLMTNLKESAKENSSSANSLKRGHINMLQNESFDSLEGISPEVIKALENESSWSYDVIALERISNKKPLAHLSMKIFSRFGVMKLLKTSDQCMFNWLQVIEEHYRPTNSYHNSTHAADVMQSAAYFLQKDQIRDVLEPIDVVATLLAAVIHDVDHPGRTNPFLVNSRHKLAILYNDIAVLENHHASLAFQLTMDAKINIFSNVSEEDYKVLRKQMIDLVLATEMARHFEHLNKFVSKLRKPLACRNEDEEVDVSCSSSLLRLDVHEEQSVSLTSLDKHSATHTQSLESLLDSENKEVLKRMIIKCSDVNNPTRPLHLCKEWAVRIAQEYFAQTDDEKRLGLPLVMPTFDRETCNIPRSQLSFIDFFLKEMFAAMNDVLHCPELVENLDANYAYWKNQGETSTSETKTG